MLKKKQEKQFNRGEVLIYKPKGGAIQLKVKFLEETVWLNLDQLAVLFGRDNSVISRHIKNIFLEKELERKSVVAKIATTAADGKTYNVEYYNLDVIISVGYRVKSKFGVQFRIWATKMLKNYLIKGYLINEERLVDAQDKFNQLKQVVAFLQNKSKVDLLKGQETGILDLLGNYSKTLTLLEQYDKNKLKKKGVKKVKFKLEYDICKEIVIELKKELFAKKEAGSIFGNQIDNKFESIIKNLYQTFGGAELYKSFEDKASHLLYLTIKDHPFSDGNKRIGSFLFVYFLDKNNCLYRESGEKKINDNALTALALLVAQSDPKEKELMVALISQLIV